MWNRKTARFLGFVTIFCAGMMAGAMLIIGQTSHAEEPAKAEEPSQAEEPVKAEEPAPTAAPKKPKGTPFGPMLRAGLSKIDGCLKVESAKTTSGKWVIFGWFEDKAAAQRWFYSETHQNLLDRFSPNRNRERTPLEFVHDDVGPIMVIASIMLPEEGSEMAFPQISIEAYSPLHAGFGRGGLFGPDEFQEKYMFYLNFFGETEEVSPELQEKIEYEKELLKMLRAEGKVPAAG